MSNSCLSQDLHQPVVVEDKRAGAQMKIDPIMQIMQKEGRATAQRVHYADLGNVFDNH